MLVCSCFTVKLISWQCWNTDVACYGRINSLLLLIEATWRQHSIVISVSGGGDPEHTLVMCLYVTLMARDTRSLNSGSYAEDVMSWAWACQSTLWLERLIHGHTRSLETVQGLLRKRERFDDSITGHGYKTLLGGICTRGILSGTSLVHGPCAHDSLRGVA